jgi:hypothetical protein
MATIREIIFQKSLLNIFLLVALASIIAGIVITSKVIDRKLNGSAWPKAEIFYEISKDFPEVTRLEILSCMKEITDISGIKFIEKSSSDINYVSILYKDMSEDACGESIIGCMLGRQELKLSQSCTTKRTIYHELMHCIGFSHEHSRPDRDNYVIINNDNIIDSMKYNFDIDSGFAWKDISKDTEFDFNSVLIYSSFGLSKNNKPVITKKNGDTILTNYALSEKDKQKLRLYYEKYKNYLI